MIKTFEKRAARLASNLTDMLYERLHPDRPALNRDDFEEGLRIRLTAEIKFAYQAGEIVAYNQTAEVKELATKFHLRILKIDRGFDTAGLPVIEKRIAPPEGHLLDDQGLLHKAWLPLGTEYWNATKSKPVPLPIFADGTMWLLNEDVWTFNKFGVHCFRSNSAHHGSGLAWEDGEWLVLLAGSQHGETRRLSECYPTEELASAAFARWTAAKKSPRKKTAKKVRKKK